MTRVLVYGTLRQGERAHGAMKGSPFVEEVRVPGFDMYGLYGFPGIKENADNKEGITGEVYEVDDNALSYLDYYEGYRKDSPANSHYIRKTIDVNGQPTDVYVYRPDVENVFHKIPSGDWKQR